MRLLWAAAGEWVEAPAGGVRAAGWHGVARAIEEGAKVARRGAWTVLQDRARLWHRCGMNNADLALYGTADRYFDAARRIRHAARLVRDLKRCL